MSRRNNSSMGAVLVIGVVVLMFILVLVALATPVILLLILVYSSKVFNKKNESLKNNESDFWLNDSDKADFKEQVSELVRVEGIIADAIEMADDAGVGKNKDGAYSARSKLGKEVRGILESNEPVRDELTVSLRVLQGKPMMLWEDFNLLMKRVQAALLSLTLWALTLLGYDYFYNDQQQGSIFTPYYNLAVNYFGGASSVVEVSSGEITLITSATVVAIASYLLWPLIPSQPVAKLTPLPAEVTLLNVDIH